LHRPRQNGFQKAQAHEFAMLIGKAHKDRATARRRRAGVVRPPPSRGQALRGIPAGMHLRMRTVGHVAWAMPIEDHEDAPLLVILGRSRKAESRGPRADAPTPCPEPARQRHWRHEVLGSAARPEDDVLVERDRKR
jgi:hypothetical protein